MLSISHSLLNKVWDLHNFIFLTKFQPIINSEFEIIYVTDFSHWETVPIIKTLVILPVSFFYTKNREKFGGY